MKNRAIPILLILALVAFLGAVYLAIRNQHPVEQVGAQAQTQSSAQPEAKQPEPKVINIPKENFVKAKWDSYGPGNDGTAQTYMSKTGSITYSVPVGQTLLTGDAVEISVKVSSELRNTRSNDIAFSSDVTVSINGVEQSTLNVIPDNTVGAFQTWKVPTSAFRPNDQNEITFAVKKDAFYKNGICFYSPIQLRFQ